MEDFIQVLNNYNDAVQARKEAFKNVDCDKGYFWHEEIHDENEALSELKKAFKDAVIETIEEWKREEYNAQDAEE